MLKTVTKVIKKVESKVTEAERIAESLIFAVEMRIYHYIVILLASAFVWSCKTEKDMAEESASLMLDEARELLAQKQYIAARDTIFSLRRQHPTALEVRRAAIVTLDSVELMETRDSILFFEERLNAARLGFSQMQPRINGHTNDAYYLQQRRVMQMEQHFDELCAKVKFYLRKIDIDQQEF